jgi:hypothetical protein
VLFLRCFFTGRARRLRKTPTSILRVFNHRSSVTGIARHPCLAFFLDNFRSLLGFRSGNA